MRLCNKCVLPDTFPEISFNSEGTCNFCQVYEKEKSNKYNISEGELKQLFDRFRQKNDRYDLVICVSGGVDSSNALINIVEKFQLRPLAFHNDHGYEDPTALENVRRLCLKMDVDLLVWQNDIPFMKKMWKYLFESKIKDLNPCYVCGNMIYASAVHISKLFNIPLMMNGYSKGQAESVQQKDKVYPLLEFIEETKRQDSVFSSDLKSRLVNPKTARFWNGRNSLAETPEKDSLLVMPYYALSSTYKTDKNALRAFCKEKFQWQPPQSSYPHNTTNCRVVWLSAEADFKRNGYTSYHDEYARLVRCGEMTRDQALHDLEFLPDPVFMANIKKDIGL